jgi:ATP-binding cassette subfamily F protein 3
MVKSRQRKLDERWGNERSASGGRFKLNRDLAGYHLTSRAEIDNKAREAAVKLKIHDPPGLKTLGDLIHFDNVAFRYKGKKEPMLQNVSFTVDQGGRCAFVGAVSIRSSTVRD